MRKVFTIALLCAGLVFAANDKPSDLKQVPKSEIAKLNATFKTLKKKQDAKTRAVINVSALTIDANTDSLYQFSIGNQQMFIATKLGQTTFAPAQKIGVMTEEDGIAICAYMGTNKLDPTVPGAIQEPRVGINSVGGWFYLTSYPTSELVIFDRSSWQSDKIEHVVFRFVLTTNGYLVIRRTLSEGLTTDNLTSPKPVPLNKWVYIQGRQNGLEHSLGWKTADDESTATKRFSTPNVELKVLTMRSAFMNEVYAESNSTLRLSDRIAPNSPVPSGEDRRPESNGIYAPNGTGCTTRVFATYNIFPEVATNISVQEFFWQPNMAMFALMDNYNAAKKDIGQKVSTTFGLDTALIQELINAANGTSNVLRFLPSLDSTGMVTDNANVDVYVDDNFDAVLFDMRRVPPAR
ncbi:MAG: hypothetical protein K2O85_09215 [Helicobacter sp.]|nr:hypothetical protein [Helicobacter sp.]